MEGQEKEKQVVEYLIKGGINVAVFFIGGFFVKVIFSLDNFNISFNCKRHYVISLAKKLLMFINKFILLASATFNIILTSKTALSRDKAVFN